MRKPRLLKVLGYLALIIGRDYHVRAAEVHANMKSQRLLLRLEHLDRDQEGRVDEVILPLPVRPHGRTASFFRACGMDVSVDAEINPAGALGRVIVLRLLPTTGGLEGHAFSFSASTKESHDGTSTT